MSSRDLARPRGSRTDRCLRRSQCSPCRSDRAWSHLGLGDERTEIRSGCLDDVVECQLGDSEAVEDVDDDEARLIVHLAVVSDQVVARIDDGRLPNLAYPT